MEDVRNWLRGCGLEQYATKFEEEGWDNLECLFEIDDDNLKICISKAGHRKQFELALRKGEAITNPIVVPIRGNKSSKRESAKYMENTDDNVTVASSENPVQSKMATEEVTRSNDKDERIHFDDRQYVTDEECTEIHVPGPCNFDLLPVAAEERISRQLVPSTQINVVKADCIEIIGSGFYSDEGNGRQNYFKKQMQTMIKVFQEKDEMYVETRAFEELVQIVKYSHMAVIIGVPGDGKSTMAYHLSLKYNKKGYEHLELHFAREWKDYVDGSSGKGTGTKQFILIDDMFGRLSIDERRLNEWMSIFDLMQKVVEQRDGDLIVVCTSRKYVFMDVKPKLIRFSSFQDHKLVDMTSDRFSLTTSEKLAIWNKYSTKYNVNTAVPDSINKEIPTPHGFPHCVELFCTSIILQKEGGSFFENPMKYVDEQITYFMHYDRIKYCVLLLVLLHKNKLSKCFVDQLSHPEKKFGRVCDAAGLSTQPRKVDVKRALFSLKGTYITELDIYYRLSHDSVRENLALLFIKENTDLAIQELDFFYLTDHIRCHGQRADDEKVGFILPREKNIVLIKRMIKAIKTGNAVAVCAHPAWESIPFLEEFMQCALQTVDNDLEKTFADPRSIADIFNTKDNSASCIFYYNLLEALDFFRRRNALNNILENKDLKRILQDAITNVTEVPRDRSLSSKLCRIMDNLGATKEVRMFQMRSAITMEILDTLCTKLANREFSCFIFGSQAEGTHVPTHISKLNNPYISYLFCLENCEVIHDISEASANTPVDLLTVSDGINEPGYVKLQVVLDGVPQTVKELGEYLPVNTKLDYKDRVCVHRKHPDQIRVDVNTGSETTTNIITGDSVDICHSYRCRTWPDIAKRWQNRVRQHNWPSRYALEQMKSLGIFLVPVGCHDSIEKHLEWKMCFLLQERQLMYSLNQTQHKCYILLKLINNDIISHFVEEHALISYHLKICLFHVIENTAGDIWVPEKLLYCVKQCLNCILKWTINGMCPNYFIPEENMFSRRIHGELQTKLRKVLEMILCSEFEYLLQIRCGNIGPWLEQTITGKPGHITVERFLAPDNINMHFKMVRFIVLVRDRILSKCYDHDLQTCVSNHLETVSKLREIENITKHSKEQTKNSISLVLPYVELSFMNNLVAFAAEKDSERQLLTNLLFSKRWQEISEISNSFSAKLKQATYLYMLDFPHVSLQILDTLSMSLGPFMISICGCRNFQSTTVDGDTKEYLKAKSEEEFRIKYCMPCLVFLPTEKVPVAIRSEMERFNETSSTLRDVPYRFGSDWVVLDSKVLFYYLLYLNHVTLDMTKEAASDIENLNSVLKTDSNLGHKDSGFNILGWIYRQEGHEQRAETCFQESRLERQRYSADVTL